MNIARAINKYLEELIQFPFQLLPDPFITICFHRCSKSKSLKQLAGGVEFDSTYSRNIQGEI